MIEEVKLRYGKYRYKAKMLRHEGRYYFHFKFNRGLMGEIKAMEKAQYHGFAEAPNRDVVKRHFNTDKIWSVADTPRNRFQLAYLQGENPYEEYDKPIESFDPTRPLYTHQVDMSSFMLTRRKCLIAGEMGTGKTLAAIEVMERSGSSDWWYIAPRSALKAVEREMRKWDSKVIPKFMTYEGLVKEMKLWEDGQKAPFGAIFDESSKAKNQRSQRSQACLALANGIREDHPNGFVILMSGSPAPKSPVDWWHQCEIACPGFLREGTPEKFRLRLGLFEERESFAGGVFMQHVTWLDDEAKCGICGNFENDPAHDVEIAMVSGANYHPFQKSDNEVEKLYNRMDGLVMVKFKKDCLELPEKVYRTIYCKPMPKTLRSASLIKKKATTAVSALTLLRELSDGFQYEDIVDGKTKCPRCNGDKQVYDWIPKDGIDEDEIEMSSLRDEEGVIIPEKMEEYFVNTKIDCPTCDAAGEVDKIVRSIKEVECPKDQVLKDLLDEHADVGRIVIFAGFAGSVDRCTSTTLQAGWSVLRVDGRGWKFIHPTQGVQDVDHLEVFQEKLVEYPKVAFIGQPGAAGMGLTLTAAPTIVYFSNDFNAESRIQSEDRIHRPGMDTNRGATIIDLIHLPTDQLVLENLQKKRKLQDLTLGLVETALEAQPEDRVL